MKMKILIIFLFFTGIIFISYVKSNKEEINYTIIGEKELFYIMSRGFELKEAMKLMVRARFNKILENIKNVELKDEILKEIDIRLD